MKFVFDRRTRIKITGNVNFRENREHIKAVNSKLLLKTRWNNGHRKWKVQRKKEKNGGKMKQVGNRKQKKQGGHCKRRDGENAWKTEFVMNRKKRIKISQNEKFTEKSEENAREMNNLIKTRDSE